MAQKSGSQNFLYGALILSFATAIVKIIGAFYKIPIGNLLGEAGSAHFTVAYNVFSTLFVISTAGLPIAISKLVAESEADSRPDMTRAVFRTATIAFLVIGLTGSAALYFFAPLLANLLKDPNAAPAIRAIAPAIFFIGLICPVRGYHQGKGNMIPTAVSQVIEALGKLIFGLILLKMAIDAAESLDIQAANAITGITIGSAIAMVYLWVCGRPRSRVRFVETINNSAVLKRIMFIAIPITISSSVLSVGNLIDTSQILGRLQEGAGFTPLAAEIYYGAYSWSFTLFNLPSAFILTLAVSVIPAIASARVRHDEKAVADTIVSSMRITGLLALPCAAGLMALSHPILSILYPARPEGVTVAAPLLFSLGFAVLFVCLTSLTNAMLQSLGLVFLPVVTMLIGVVVKIIVNYTLVGDPAIHINGAPLGTILCYGLITILNMAVLLRATGAGFRMFTAFFKPLVASVVMFFVTKGIYSLFSGIFFAEIGLVTAVIAAVFTYFFLIIIMRTLPKSDIMLIPKGEKIAALLKIR